MRFLGSWENVILGDVIQINFGMNGEKKIDEILTPLKDLGCFALFLSENTLSLNLNFV